METTPAGPESKPPDPGRGLRIGAVAIFVGSAGLLLYLSGNHFVGDPVFTLLAAGMGMWGVIIAVGLYGLGLWASRSKPQPPAPPPGSG